MRIAVWHNLPSGGAKRALYDQVRGLLARGHEVESWCPPSADQTYLPLSEQVPEHVVPLRRRSPFAAGRQLHPVNWSIYARLRDIHEHCRECARQIHRGQFDLLFAASCMFFHTPTIGRFASIPRVLYLQEPNRFYYEALPELPWVPASWRAKDLFDPPFLRKALVRKLRLRGIRKMAREERSNAMAFNQILVNSFFSRESVLRAFGVDSAVSYLGVDTDRFVNQRKKRESFAVSLAALFPMKNIEFLIQSLAKVASTHRPKLYMIANMIDQAYLERLQALANNCSVDIEVKYRVTDEELIDLLNRARMMLYAPRLEPFGYAPLEANACGLPVVAVAEGGVRETIEHGKNGFLVEPDPNSMAEAIGRLSADDSLHQQMGYAARNLVVAKWSLSASIDCLERRLETVLQRHGRESVPANATVSTAQIRYGENPAAHGEQYLPLDMNNNCPSRDASIKR